MDTNAGGGHQWSGTDNRRRSVIVTSVMFFNKFFNHSADRALLRYIMIHDHIVQTI